jgi:hypothetical protein
MTVPQEVALARHAGDLDDDGHDAVENLVTAETDTSLVVAPDGAGGVEFRAETGGGSSLTIKDEGSSLTTAATSIDFVGAGVTASGTGAAKTVTIPGSSGGQHILLADGHSTPFTFNDLLQMDDGSDFMWSDPA